MRVRVLGAAAGGGFPQWNCACPNCRAVRAGSPHFAAQTQASVAVSADGERWYLLNTSPDIRAQVEGFAALHPPQARGSPIRGAIFTNGDLDSCLGIFSLRESEPLRLYATEAVRRGLVDRNALFRTFSRFEGHVTFGALQLGGRVSLDAGLSVEAVPAPGKVPLHLTESDAAEPSQNVGLLIRSETSSGVLGFFPSVAGPTPELERAVSTATCCFFDGTFWTEDELLRSGLGTRTAREMAHWPLSGAEGSLAWLSRVATGRRALIHINNTNPILNRSSAERGEVERAGVEVAYDGMELQL